MKIHIAPRHGLKFLCGDPIILAHIDPDEQPRFVMKTDAREATCRRCLAKLKQAKETK